MNSKNLVLAILTKPIAVITEDPLPRKARKLRTEGRLAADPEESEPKWVPKSVKLVGKGTMTAPEFFVALRRATDRNGKIAAIVEYCGYETGQDFGTQEFNAIAKARHEICPVASGIERHEQQAMRREAKGYVSGIPDNQRRIIQDLLARERIAAEELSEYMRTATSKKFVNHDRKFACGMARLEMERIASIRADLAEYGIIN
jgi:hypothetical protein